MEIDTLPKLLKRNFERWGEREVAFRDKDYPARHQQYTGVSNRGILRNLEQLVEHRRAVRVRIPVVPVINDSDEDA